jgi:hypothetical protein
LDAIARSPNQLLAALSAADLELLRSHLETIELVQEDVLVAAGDRLTRIFFPHNGAISLVGMISPPWFTTTIASGAASSSPRYLASSCARFFSASLRTLMSRIAAVTSIPSEPAGNLRVVHDVAELTGIVARRMQAQQRNSASRFFDENPMGFSTDIDRQIPPGDWFEVSHRRLLSRA